MSIDCEYDYGCVWIVNTLDKKGPLSLVDLKWQASETFRDGEWSEYLQACFDHMVWRKKIIQVGKIGELYDVIDELRLSSIKEPKKLDPDREYYCKKCFYVLRKLTFMRTMGDTGIHICPDCKDVEKMGWMEVRSYCDIFILHYRKLKDQVEREMELQEDDDK